MFIKKLVQAVVVGAVVGGLSGFLLFRAFSLIDFSGGVPQGLDRAKRNVIRLSILGQASCSAVVISDRVAVTAAHCIPDPQSWLFFGLSGQGDPMFEVTKGITVIPRAVLDRTDGAILNGNFDGYAPLQVDLNDGEVFEKNKEVVVCGFIAFNPEARCVEAKHVRNSIFSALYQLTVLPGQSGGAVFNKKGKLIGIISAMSDDGLAVVHSTAGLLSHLDLQ